MRLAKWFLAIKCWNHGTIKTVDTKAIVKKNTHGRGFSGVCDMITVFSGALALGPVSVVGQRSAGVGSCVCRSVRGSAVDRDGVRPCHRHVLYGVYEGKGSYPTVVTTGPCTRFQSESCVRVRPTSLISYYSLSWKKCNHGAESQQLKTNFNYLEINAA